jgi:hypothetical protein
VTLRLEPPSTATPGIGVLVPCRNTRPLTKVIGNWAGGESQRVALGSVGNVWQLAAAATAMANGTSRRGRRIDGIRSIARAKLKSVAYAPKATVSTPHARAPTQNRVVVPLVVPRDEDRCSRKRESPCNPKGHRDFNQ